MGTRRFRCFNLLVVVVCLYLTWLLFSNRRIVDLLSSNSFRRGKPGQDASVHNLRLGFGTGKNRTSNQPDKPDQKFDLGQDAQKLINQTYLTLTRGHSMTLAIHMSYKPLLVSNFFCIFLRSAVVFWPRQYGDITLILDEESAQDHEFAANLKAQEDVLDVIFNIKYQPLPADPSVLDKPWRRERGSGLHRQMWNSYFLDLYVDTPIVVWMDTDNMFNTPVTPENIFQGDKLKMFGWDLWINSEHESLVNATFRAIGKKLVAHFGYFPTYIWRDTVTNCRKHILKHLNVSRFEDAFNIIHGPQYTYPANTIITYAYYYENDRYDWHIQLHGHSLADYNRWHVEPGSYIRPSQTTPDVSVAIHKPQFRNKPRRSQSPFEQGYCVALSYIGQLTRRCKQLKIDFDTQLFMLHMNTYRLHPKGWCGGYKLPASCVNVVETHYNTFVKYYKTGLYDFNLQRITTVEKVAAEMNVTCLKLMK